MSDGGWNPMPNNTARPAPKPAARARGEELWRLTSKDPDSGSFRVVSCELRDDSNVGAGFEILVRQDDEIILGRRGVNEAEARYYANAFKQDYARSGWTA
jgi:hypothetical protein